MSRRRRPTYLHSLTHLLAGDSELPDRYGDGCFLFFSFFVLFRVRDRAGLDEPFEVVNISEGVFQGTRTERERERERERILTVGLVDAAPRTADGRVCSERFFLLLVTSLLAFACSLFLQRSPGWLPSLFM